MSEYSNTKWDDKFDADLMLPFNINNWDKQQALQLMHVLSQDLPPKLAKRAALSKEKEE